MIIKATLCTYCWDEANVDQVEGCFPQRICDRCGRRCMGYGARVDQEFLENKENKEHHPAKDAR